ncbi:MAG: DNA-3-methyladenine glycosylase [Bacteroidetes bacterium]|nr:MAG: DNA-3-methyladenine glycosylase [Bacteroidota bacterium]
MRLEAPFYQREDVVAIARELLGMVLVTEIGGGRCAARIVETEAYRAPEDRASHAYGNRRTPRTEVMFRPGGVAYIYLCYGMHHLFNVVTGREGMAHAVLVRAVEPLENVELMLRRRRMKQPAPQLTAGPGVLTQALGIHTSLTGTSLLAPDSPIWLEDRGLCPPQEKILRGPRVGVDYSGPCASWPWRFAIEGSAYLSPAKKNTLQPLTPAPLDP